MLGSHPAGPSTGPALSWAIPGQTASVAEIPATQLASQSWALTKNLGSHPVQLLKSSLRLYASALSGPHSRELRPR